MNLDVKDVTDPGQAFGVRCKTAWLDAAEIFDSWRIIPRVILFLYGFWMVRLTDWLVRWYEKLPAAERTAQVTAFVTIVLPGVFGLAVYVYKIYSAGGRDWDKPPDGK
jgi:hypothetical protein